MCLGILFMAGCTSDGPIKDIIHDKQFSAYQADLDSLERDYLQKKLTYADYLQKKKIVEEDYQKKIDSRRNLIQNQPSVATEMVP